MNCASFLPVLVAHARVVELAGSQSAAGELRVLASFFDGKSGTAQAALKLVPLEQAPRNHGDIVRLLRAIGEAAQAAGPATSKCYAAFDAMANAASRTRGESAADIVAAWSEAGRPKPPARPPVSKPPARKPLSTKTPASVRPATVGPGTVTPAHGGHATKPPASEAPAGDPVAIFVERLRTRPPSDSLNDLAAMGKALKAPDLVKVLEQFLEAAQPKRSKADHLNWLRRRLEDEVQRERKGDAFFRR